jgi:hypothetical protein
MHLNGGTNDLVCQFFVFRGNLRVAHDTILANPCALRALCGLRFLGHETKSLATKSTKSTKENDELSDPAWRRYSQPEFPQWTNVIRPILDHKMPKLFLNSA